LILDIDETLISFVTLDDFNSIPVSEHIKYEIVTQSIDGNPIISQFSLGYFDKGIIVKRPNVDTFLKFAFSECIVSIWTRNSKEFANQVANILTNGKPEKFQNIWSYNDVDEAYKRNSISKDLTYLWENVKKGEMFPCNTILVDDALGNTDNNSNKFNSIKAHEFSLFTYKPNGSFIYKDSSNDSILLKIIEVLKGVLNNPNFCKRTDVSPFTTLQNISGGRRRKLTRKSKFKNRFSRRNIY
jgi:hypothetical protein